MDGWNTSFLLGWTIFRGEVMLVSGRVSGWPHWPPLAMPIEPQPATRARTSERLTTGYWWDDEPLSLVLDF